MLFGITIFSNASTTTIFLEETVISGAESPEVEEEAFENKEFEPHEILDSSILTASRITLDPLEFSLEESMIYEAAAIGLAHYTNSLNNTAFLHDPNISYSELLEDDSFQLEFTNFVLPYKLGNLQSLSDLLTTANYPAIDVELFVDCWAVTFARMPLMDIYLLITELDDREVTSASLLELNSIANVDGMLSIVFSYYDSVLINIYEAIMNLAAQDAFGMSYSEAEVLYYGTQEWYDFEEAIGSIRSLFLYSFYWTLASYLKNLVTLNDIELPFDEVAMVRETMDIGMFNAMLLTVNATFRYNPNGCANGCTACVNNYLPSSCEIITISPSSVNLTVGQTVILSSSHEVIWSLNPPESTVASVDSNGMVTALNPGRIQIRAASTENAFSRAVCTVMVFPPATGISIDGASTHNVAVGQTLQLTATVTPGNANNNVIWSSNNTTAVTVNTRGLITAVAGGAATITARTADGSHSASVTVIVGTLVTGVSIGGAATREITPRQTLQLATTVAPSNATNKNVRWSSSNSTAATVGSTNGLVTAVAVGSTTITARTVDGNYTASVIVTVAPIDRTFEIGMLKTAIKVGIAEATIPNFVYNPATFNPNSVTVDNNTMQFLLDAILQYEIYDLYHLRNALASKGHSSFWINYGMSVLRNNLSSYTGESAKILSEHVIYEGAYALVFDSSISWFSEREYIAHSSARYFNGVYQKIQTQAKNNLNNLSINLYTLDHILIWAYAFYIENFDQWNDDETTGNTTTNSVMENLSGFAAEFTAALMAPTSNGTFCIVGNTSLTMETNQSFSTTGSVSANWSVSQALQNGSNVNIVTLSPTSNVSRTTATPRRPGITTITAKIIGFSRDKYVIVSQKPSASLINRSEASDYRKLEIGYPLGYSANSERTDMNLISSRYGPRNAGLHLGLDIVAPTTSPTISNVPILAVTSGTIRDRNTSWSGTSSGFRVSIESDQYFCPQTKQPLIFTYMHMVARTPFNNGDYVQKGTVIGNVGSTGAGSDIHLHFEITNRGHVNFNDSREVRLPNAIDPVFFYPPGQFYWAPWSGGSLLRNQRTYNFILWSETQMTSVEW